VNTGRELNRMSRMRRGQGLEEVRRVPRKKGGRKRKKK